MNKTNSNLEFRKIKSLNYLYEINENGTIFRNVKSKKQLKIKLDFHHSDKGYYVTFVHLGGRKNSKVVRCMIHRIVAECWLGDIPDGMEVDHKDRNPHNNDWHNLRYVTKSEQMRNRDHTNISKIGALNLQKAREARAIHVTIKGLNECISFNSKSECSDYLSKKYNKTKAQIAWKLTKERKHIYGYDIFYRNAETGHGGFTEQGTVHRTDDLTNDYTTAFNLGKQEEVEKRVKHVKIIK